PVMAMLRIPTADSDGKANIHLGGIGIGIDMAKGETTYAAQYHNIVEDLPHGEVAAGHKIPYWDEILLICSRIQQITNIGYLACDIAIDEQMGPALLEVNARAGLMVQVANLAPLKSRLERVQGITVDSPEKGVRIGQDLFGSKAKKVQDNDTDGKPTLGIEETIQITLSDGSTLEVDAKVVSDKEQTVFSNTLINSLLESRSAEPGDIEGSYRVKFVLCGKKIQTLVQADSLEGKDRVMLGSRDLAGFLIDPSKKTEKKAKKKAVRKTDLRAVDRQMGQIDKDLLLLKYIKPLNLEEEMERLKEDELYNPTFVYSEIKANVEEAEKKLSVKITDTSPLGKLLEKKRIELQRRIALLRARGKNEEFTKASEELYGTPTKALLNKASTEVANRVACDLLPNDDQLVTAEKALPFFEEALKKYSLHNWQVSIRQKLVARVTVGGNKVYIRNDVTLSEAEIASLIAHEIETHVLTSENGSHQPYEILRRGTAGYLDTQEGLAIYNEKGVLSPHSEKIYNPARNVIGLQYSLSHSLAQTRTYLQSELGYSPDKALQQSVSMKRGLGDTSDTGGFTKSMVYFRGLKAIEKFVDNGGDLKRLYIGKISLEDLETIEALEKIKAPLILPEFLR
ncbi:MAG: DUF1704 domain-containing protein, partial [Candidatus Peribacteraceae bacterium]|nr:DUF1704 domain-containing protein [Candidatus Peribacteraceae bacterium]